MLKGGLTVGCSSPPSSITPYSLLNRHFVAHADLEIVVRRAIADGDFEEAAAADQGQRLAGGDVPVGALHLADRAAVDADVHRRLLAQRVLADICGRVAEVVDVNDAAA